MHRDGSLGERLLSIGEVAELFAVSPTTVRRLIATGQLPAVRIGGQLRIEAVAIRRFIGGRLERSSGPTG